jgi:hypothetical protein
MGEQTEARCLAEPPQDGMWGDCWCTLPAKHAGPHYCVPCTDRFDTPGWESQPTWSDLGVMARNFGWTPERWTPGQVHWGRRNPNGFIEHRHGWARVRRLRVLGHVVIDVYSPAEHEDLASSARLVDPTPSRVLSIARELGIGAS